MWGLFWNGDLSPGCQGKLSSSLLLLSSLWELEYTEEKKEVAQVEEKCKWILVSLGLTKDSLLCPLLLLSRSELKDEEEAFYQEDETAGRELVV